jgi:hypothetical protein
MRIIEFAYAEQRFEKLIVPHSETVEKIVYSDSRFKKKISSNSALFCARLVSKDANSTQKQF